MFGNHAEFRLENNSDSFVYIVDLHHLHNCKTVTNDVERVLSILNGHIENFENKRLFYKDSEGLVAEIVHSGERFISFKAGHEGVTL